MDEKGIYFVLAYRSGPEGASNTNYIPKINRHPHEEEVKGLVYVGRWNDLGVEQLEEIVSTISDHRGDDSSLDSSIREFIGE